MILTKIKTIHSLLVLAVLFVFFCACSKNGDSLPELATETGNPILPTSGDVNFNIVVNPLVTGLKIAADFTGLSYETNATVSGKYFSSSFTKHVNLIKNLGSSGILRVGGNSADKSIWNNSLRNGSTDGTILYKDDVDRFFGFANAVGWKSMWTLNVGTGTVSQANDEAKYISQNYAANLLYYELGNEPDLFHNWARIPPAFPLYPDPNSYLVKDYILDFENFHSSIFESIPGAKFSGAANCSHLPDFAIPFLNREKEKLSQLTFHYYFSQAGAANATIANLLADDPTLVSNTTTLLNAAKTYNLPFRYGETNSLSGGGQYGVSNKLASALWATDFMFGLAKMGCNGVNFHGGNAGPYTPIAYNGDVTPRPIYYGMLAFSLASKGSFLLSSSSASGGSVNCKTYTVLGDDGKYYITIINKDLVRQAFVTINGMPANHTTQIIRLIGTSVADIAVADNVTLGNATTDSNGNWTNASSEKAGWDKTSYQLQVPKTSIAILIIDK